MVTRKKGDYITMYLYTKKERRQRKKTLIDIQNITILKIIYFFYENYKDIIIAILFFAFYFFMLLKGCDMLAKWLFEYMQGL